MKFSSLYLIFLSSTVGRPLHLERWVPWHLHVRRLHNKETRNEKEVLTCPRPNSQKSKSQSSNGSWGALPKWASLQTGSSILAFLYWESAFISIEILLVLYPNLSSTGKSHFHLQSNILSNFFSVLHTPFFHDFKGAKPFSVMVSNIYKTIFFYIKVYVSICLELITIKSYLRKVRF